MVMTLYQGMDMFYFYTNAIGACLHLEDDTFEEITGYNMSIFSNHNMY